MSLSLSRIALTYGIRKANLSLGIEMEHKHLRFEHKPQHEPNLLPACKLHPWQRIGVTFLHQCCEYFGVALLADDMGVGKVILQMCWFVVLIGRPFNLCHFFKATIGMF
jgi:hypothetical protein